MSLEDYVRKRSFPKTPEPSPPPETAAAPGNRFCVQRHHARRLHYDFRLEMQGTLKSWAVPKGPTMDPAEKRLAVEVEDHPLEYGGFEGTIPAGNYGAGSVMLWDRGVYELLGEKTAPEQMERGDLKFRLQGEKLSGEFALVRMKGRGKGKEWLLLKKKDAVAQAGWDAESHSRSVLSGRTQEEIAREIAPKKVAEEAGLAGPSEKSAAASLPGAIRAKMPASLQPMQAFPAASLPPGDNWLYEVKWDGVRALCLIDGGKVRLLSRKGTSIDAQYPELSVLHHYVQAETAVLDGEIAVLDEQGRPDFALIQPRISVTDAAAIAHLARSQPVTFFAFDLLYCNGYDLRRVPLKDRKQALESILKPCSVTRYSEHFESDGQRFLEAARQKGLEGIVAKRAASRYESRRSKDWLKIKIVAQQEFVICGYTAGEREYFGALALGVYEQGSLAYAGNVGTGFDERMLEDIYRRLKPLATSRCPFRKLPKLLKAVTWVRPELVCEVRYAAWTRDGRLRAPVFVGLRFDADAKDCVRETALEVSEVSEETTSTVSRPPLLSGQTGIVSLSLEGRRLRFTNLNKVYFPRDGYTKRDLINFYDAVADLLLPYLKGRPLSLKRYPDGIQAEYFFQKDAAPGTPAWLRIEPIATDHGAAPTRFIVADDRAALLYLANLGCIDQNPWMSRVGSLANPDFILIDLDPQDCGYAKIVEAAQLVRQKLDRIGLEGYPKTTGGDGMHIYVPVEPCYTYEQTRSFAEVIARLVAAERPGLFTTPRPVSRREKGKVYFDYLQNAEGRTIAAPYVLRAYPGAPVATPLAWREVSPELSPAQFHIRNVLDRFARVGDLFGPVLTRRQRLEKPFKRLEGLVRNIPR